MDIMIGNGLVNTRRKGTMGKYLGEEAIKQAVDFYRSYLKQSRTLKYRAILFESCKKLLEKKDV